MLLPLLFANAVGVPVAPAAVIILTIAVVTAPFANAPAPVVVAVDVPVAPAAVFAIAVVATHFANAYVSVVVVDVLVAPAAVVVVTAAFADAPTVVLSE